jgi:5-methylcytosine-specific restriction endonuclease McrBC regulatory subunit McrC
VRVTARTEADGLIPVVVQALWRQTGQAIHQGLLPGYVTVEETSPFLCGRPTTQS